jgi:hypothetical protein
LHGHLLDAVRLNALFVVLLPFGLACGLECYRRAMRPGVFIWPEIPRPVVYAGVAVAGMFMIARNLLV